MAMFKRSFARTIPDSFEGTAHENEGFRGKKGQKVHPNFALNITMEFHYHAFCAPGLPWFLHLNTKEWTISSGDRPLDVWRAAELQPVKSCRVPKANMVRPMKTSMTSCGMQLFCLQLEASCLHGRPIFVHAPRK